MESSAPDDADGSAHPYYQLLPSYVTPESVRAERHDLLLRVQELLQRLVDLRDGVDTPDRLQSRHFRDVDTFLKLKHQLPESLHARLVRVLLDLLWTQDARAFRDVDLEIRALRVLQLLLTKWKKRLRWTEAPVDEDIVVDWRAVRRNVERVCFRASGGVQQASQTYLTKLATVTVKCAERARSFFLASDPAVPLMMEMWTEFSATVKDVKTTECFRALALFTFFVSLPKTEDAKVQEQAVVALLPEWFSTWALISRCGEWDGHWMKLLSRVAKRFPSTTMLTDYYPFVFAKVADLLELPSDLGAPFKKKVWPSVYSSVNGSKRFGQHTMRLCTYLLCKSNDDGSDAAPTHFLLELLRTMKSFFHPSNVANVGNSLATFAYYLSNEFGKRLGTEKNSAHGLQVTNVRKIVDVLREMCFLGMYSKNRGVAMKCMYVLKNLLCIDPALCAAPVMEEMLKALDPMAMSHSHLAVTAISSMAVFVYQLMCGQHPQSTGLFFSTYVEPMLKLTLPGIDANDEKKTESTLQLYFHLLSWLPLVNDPAKSNFQATKQRGKLSEEIFTDLKNSLFAEITPLDSQTDGKLWELGPFVEEWSFALLDRCFQFIQSRSGSRSASSNATNGRGLNGKSSGKDGSEDAIVLQVLNLLAILYAQMSPEVYRQALRKTVTFVSNSFFTTSFGGKVVSTLVYNCMQGDPSLAISQFMPFVLEKFHVTKLGLDVSTLMTNEKVWTIKILEGLVRFNHPDDRILLHYKRELEVILGHFLTVESEKEVYEAAGTVLRHLLYALLGVYTHDFRSLPSAEWNDAISHESGAFQYLGAGISWGKLSVGWHEPNEAELAFGYSLLQDYVLNGLDELDRLKENEDVTVRLWTRHLDQVFQGLRGAANILVDDTIQADSALLGGSTHLLHSALASNLELLRKYVALKRTLIGKVHELTAFWRSHGNGSSVEIQVWQALLDIMNQLLIWRGAHLDEFNMKERRNMFSKITGLDIASYAYRKNGNDSIMCKKKYSPLLSRNEMVEKVMFFYDKRKVQQHFALANAMIGADSDTATRQLYESMLEEVESLLKNPYEAVRSSAAAVMKECSVLYARWIYYRQVKNIEELEGLGQEYVTELKEEQVSGTLHMLSLRLASRNLWKKRDSLLLRVFVLLLKSNDAIVKKVDTEASKMKVEVKLQAFFLALLSNWRCIRGQETLSHALETLVAIEPSTTEHWKFQLMHLVMLYPFLQQEAMPISASVWNLVIRQLSNELLPVRQISLELFRHLIKLLKQVSKTSGDTEVFDGLIYANTTMPAVLAAILNNHKNMNRFAASADGQHAESAPSDWSFGVNEVVRYITSNTQSYPKAAPLSSVRLLNQSSDTFTNVNLSNVKLVQRLVQENPKAFLESGVMKELRDMASEKINADITEEDRQAAYKTLADFIAGLLHSLAKLDTIEEEDITKHTGAVTDILKVVLPQVSIVLVDQWVEVAYLCARPSRSGAVKLVRLQPLIDYILQQLEDSFVRATAEDYARQAKWLALVEAIGIHLLAAGASESDKEVHTLASAFSGRVLRVLREHALTHQYKIIRDRVGKMLFVLGAYAFPTSPWLTQSSSSLLAVSSLPLFELVSASAVSSSEIDEQDDAEQDTRLHAKETAMQWLACCEKYGDMQDEAAVLHELLPIALLSQNHPKPEVALLAKNTTNAVSLSLRLYSTTTSEEDATRLLDLLERLSTSKVWKTRGAVLRFTMTFSFYHWLFLSDELKQRVHAFVCGFLTDEQREVQAMAKYALRGLVHNEPPAAVEAMAVRLRDTAEQARTKFPKLRRRCERLTAEDAPPEELQRAQDRLKSIEAKMMESVLGLSAIVLAFPHDVPSFVPPIFEEVGRFLYMKRSSNTISFLEKAVKETLLDFKRTHQDNWLETKSKFTQAQLDVIEDVAIAPSYFS